MLTVYYGLLAEPGTMNDSKIRSRAFLLISIALPLIGVGGLLYVAKGQPLLVFGIALFAGAIVFAWNIAVAWRCASHDRNGGMLSRLTHHHLALLFSLAAATSIIAYSFIYIHTGIQHGTHFVEKPDLPLALYFSCATFTTLGYGDFTPSPASRLIAATEALSGYVLLGTLVAMLTSFLGTPPPPTPSGQDRVS